MIIEPRPGGQNELLTVTQDPSTLELTVCAPRPLTGWQLYLVMRAVQRELKRVNPHTDMAEVVRWQI